MSFHTLTLTVLTIMGVYALLAIGLNMHWGDTGLLNFAHAGFFAVGGYTSAILTTPADATGLLANRTVGFDLPIAVGIVAAVLVTAALGAFIALPSIRLEGDYLAMVTLSIAEVIRLLIYNEGWLTSGAQSLNNIPRPFSGVEAVPYDAIYFAILAVMLAASYVVFVRLAESPFGRILHAIREDEAVPQALGKRTSVFKLKSFALGAGVAGLAGALWAHYVYALTPNMFLPNVTFLIWAAVIIGGAGSYAGAIVGTVFVMGIRQLTRFLPSDIPLGGELPYLRLIVVGVALIAVLYFRPQGLLGDEERMLAGTSEGGE